MAKKKEERTCLTCRYLGIRYGKGCYHCLKYGGKTNPYVVPFDDLPAEIKESNEAGSKAALEALSDLGLIPTKESDLAWAIAQRLHDAWSEKKLEQGWAYGPVRDDRKKIHPDLLPYSALSEEDRSYDYEAACSALKALRDQGLALEAKLIGGPIG
jgi:hypothetical protein